MPGVDGLKSSDVDDGDAEAIGGDVEVGQRLLVGRIDVDEDDGFRIVAGDDGALRAASRSRLVEAAEEVPERWIETEGDSVLFADGKLESEDGREGLHLDESRSRGCRRDCGRGRSRR